MNHIQLLEAAFRKTLELRGTDWSIQGQTFQGIRGRYVSEIQSAESEEFIAAAAAGVADSLNTFAVSTLRSTFPASLLTPRGTASFKSGTICRSSSQASYFIVEAVNDNPESPWIRIFLRES